MIGSFHLPTHRRNVHKNYFGALFRDPSKNIIEILVNEPHLGLMGVKGLNKFVNFSFLFKLPKIL